MKKLLAIIAVTFLCQNLSAQDDSEALLYSMTGIYSTPRSIGMGGAMGAIGADPSAFSINPAGLAQYRKNEFSLSFGTTNNYNSATYFGQTNGAKDFNFNIPHVSFVNSDNKFRNNLPKTTGWVNTNFGISFNRIADFNRNIYFEGVNIGNTYLDFVADEINKQGLFPDDFGDGPSQAANGFEYWEDMFYHSFLIEFEQVGNSYRYFANVLDPNLNFIQKQRLNTSGSMNEIAIAFAGNYEHKVYLGGGLNINTVNYTKTNEFTEFDDERTADNFRSYTYTKDYSSNGVGVNMQLGVIYKPIDFVKLGLSYQSPTFINLSNIYSENLYSVWDNGGVEDYSTIEGNYDYTITTPDRITLSAAAIDKKLGLISADFEVINYQNMNISSEDISVFTNINNDIATLYQRAVNIRLGAEYKINIFRIRAGYSKLGNPFKNDNNFSNSNIHLGAGFRQANFSMDAGYVIETTKDIFIPYSSSFGTPVANYTNNNNRLIIGVAFHF